MMPSANMLSARPSAFAAAQASQPPPVLPPALEDERNEDIANGIAFPSSELGESRGLNHGPRPVPLPLTNDFRTSSWWPESHQIIEYADRQAIRIQLPPGVRATFIGLYKLCVTHGRCLINGASMTPDMPMRTIYAPANHALPYIQSPDSGPCTVILQSCDDSIKALGQASGLFRGLWNTDTAIPRQPGLEALSQKSFQFVRLTNTANFLPTYQVQVQNSKDDPDGRILIPLDTTPDWLAAVAHVYMSSPQIPQKIMITGSKNAGKTTFAKFLTNGILTQHRWQAIPQQTVYWLELDPGQPEFSPAGQLSLVQITQPIFGPAFTHSYLGRSGYFKTIRAHCVGAISPKDVARRYLECAADLIATYERIRQDVGATQLVMNCPGWLIGEGRDLIEQLIVDSKPTSIVFISLEAVWKAKKDYDVLVQANEERPVIPLRRLQCMTHLRTSTQQRLMQQMSYFQHAGTKESIWFSTHLTAKEGVYLSWNRKRADFLGIVTTGDDLNPEFLAECIAGTVVALCIIESIAYHASQIRNLRHTTAEDMPYWSNHRRHAWLEVRNTRCIGYAYIQEVDLERKRLRIQTPCTKLNSFKRPDGTPGLFLLRGRIDQPIWLYTESTAWKEELEIDCEGLPKAYGTRLERPWMQEVLKDDVLSQNWRPRRDVRRWDGRQGGG